MARILIADDHTPTRSVLRQLLEARGWVVCGEARTGRDAVFKARESRPDIIIMDLRMPLVDGISAAEEISKTTPSVAILMLTLFNTPGLEDAAKKIGVRKVIDKRDAARLLLGSIGDVLAGERRENAGEHGHAM